VVRMKLGKSLRRMPLGNPGTQSIIVLSKYPFLSCPASACFYSDYYFIEGKAQFKPSNYHKSPIFNLQLQNRITETILLTTGRRSFAVCQRHMAKAGLHTAKYLPCVTHGKPRTAYNGRQRATLPWAKSILPCAILHTRQNKVGKRRATWKTSLPCALAQAHGKEWMFAECLCNDTRQRAKRAKKIYLQIQICIHDYNFSKQPKEIRK